MYSPKFGHFFPYLREMSASKHRLARKVGTMVGTDILQLTVVASIIPPDLCRFRTVFVEDRHEVYVFGGLSKGLARNDMYVFNTLEEKSEAIPPCLRGMWCQSVVPSPCPRFDHCMNIYNSSIIVFGGRGSNKELLTDLWSWSLNTRSWTRVCILSYVSTLVIP